MKHKLTYEPNNEILWFKTDGILYEADVPEFYSLINSLLEGKTNRQLLIEMDKDHKMENRKTREMIQTELEKSDITEIAYVGANAAIRMIAKVLLKTGKTKTVGEFFKTNEEAINWLTSKR